MGSESFVAKTRDKLGVKAKARKVIGQDGTYRLRESPGSYNGVFSPEKAILRPQNEIFWEDID